MKLWQVIAAVLIFKLFDGMFYFADKFLEIQAPLWRFVLAVALWVGLSIVVWLIARGFDEMEMRARNG